MKIKNTLTILIILLTTQIHLFGQCPTLLWSDEFNGTSLNASDWNVVVSGGGFGNNEKQYYTGRSSNLTVGNGKLTITALQESYNSHNYTSAKITTAGKQTFTYGRFEASIKLPRTQGLWPAFWMMPEDSEYGGWPTSGEIDIMEGLGSNTYRNFGTIHYGASVADHEYYGTTYTGVHDLSQGFHTYAVEWEPDTIKWFIDNHLFHIARPSDIAPKAWPFDKDFYMILNVAVGGWFGGDPNASTVFPQSMEVDYVRVYSNPYTLLIAGKERVIENSTQTYTIENGTADSYTWSVPAGSTITSGQGTPEITVNWGDTGGDISVEVTNGSCSNSIFTKEVIVISDDCDIIFDDFESNRIISFNTSTGLGFDQAAANPGSSNVNNSTKSALYSRNSIQYDILYYNVDVINNSEDYEKGEKALYMDVFTNAPIGSIINWQLENKARSANAYPSGRRAVFVGTTTVQNKWERIKFLLSSTPDVGTSPYTIDQFTFLFRPNTYQSYNFYIDNLMSRDIANCGPVITSNKDANLLQNFNLSPNPADNKLKIQITNESQESIQINLTDLLGTNYLTKKYEGSSVDFEESLDVSNLTPGMYIVSIKKGEHTTSKKIIIQ